MNRQIFDKIIELINENKHLCKQDLFDLCLSKIDSKEYELKFDTFTSIYGNLKRRQIFKSNNPNLNWKKLKENSINLCIKYKEYEKNDREKESEKAANCTEETETDEKIVFCRPKNIILEMANEIGISPVLMSRLILDGFIKLDELELVETESIKNKEKISISYLIRETHLLKNGRLAYEIMECTYLDDDYGPNIDFVKNLIGLEYELKLEKILIDKGISFVKEAELREIGFDKTPDFKLEIPIFLPNGTVISWIDSKATFGDEQSHSDYYENQFKFYLNRFGSGLVIYWFSYLKDIEKLNFNFTHDTNKNTIAIYDKFPEQFTILDLESLINLEMFKIPTYEELEQKEKEENEKRSEFKQNLFQKRKQINLNDTREYPQSSHTTELNNLNENQKKLRTLADEKQAESSTENEIDDDDDELLNAFISENKDIIEKPIQKTNSNELFKKPEIPQQVSNTTTTIKTITLAANPTTTSSSSSLGSGALIVNSKQRGNPILKHIRNVQWRFSDTLVPDYCMSRTCCAYYLSMKYHLLNPTYIHTRIRELGRAYDLRVLLVFVDVKEPRHCIKELEKISIISNLTMILCWTPEEVGRYLETYKAYEFKSAEAIMEKSTNQTNETNQRKDKEPNSDSNFINNLTDFLCQIKSINKTDASTLRQTFGSVKELSKASKEELNLCPGLGPLKVNRLYEIFRTPFLLPKKC